jgi:hypothetical protein
LNAKPISEKIPETKARRIKHFFIKLRNFKTLNICFQVQGPSRAFKFCKEG